MQAQVDSIQNQLCLSGSDGERTVEEVQQLVENAEADCRSTAKNIESMNERYNRHQGRLAQLQQDVNRIMERKLQLNDSLQQRGNLLERKGSIEIDIEQARIDVEEWKQLLEPKVSKQLAAQEAHIEAQRKRNVLTEQIRAKVLPGNFRHDSLTTHIGPEIENVLIEFS